MVDYGCQTCVVFTVSQLHACVFSFQACQSLSMMLVYGFYSILLTLNTHSSWSKHSIITDYSKVHDTLIVHSFIASVSS